MVKKFEALRLEVENKIKKSNIYVSLYKVKQWKQSSTILTKDYWTEFQNYD